MLISLSLDFGDLHFKLKNQGIPRPFSSRDCLDQELSKLGILLSSELTDWLMTPGQTLIILAQTVLKKDHLKNMRHPTAS